MYICLEKQVLCLKVYNKKNSPSCIKSITCYTDLAM